MFACNVSIHLKSNTLSNCTRTFENDVLPLLRKQNGHTRFTHLREPLLALDPGIWKRPDPSEVLAYAVMLDAKTGGNQLSNAWMLVYAYWPPYGGYAQKYLVFRQMTVTIATSP